MIREILEIDESKCDGCGQCIPSCAEGALYLEGGKLKLREDALCDGLGACVGECPQGALRVVLREAAAFDEAAVEAARRAAPRAGLRSVPPPAPGALEMPATPFGPGSGIGPAPGEACPGSRVREFAAAAFGGGAPRRPRLAVVQEGPAAAAPIQPKGGSRLGQWPVQLALVPESAPFLRGQDLLISADCVPFAYPAFHADFLAGKKVLVGCPKLDDLAGYTAKLTELFRAARPRSVTVVKMEVPCCAGIATAARHALHHAGAGVPLEVATIGLDGAVR